MAAGIEHRSHHPRHAGGPRPGRHGLLPRTATLHGLIIRRARPDEAEELREIEIASKAHWGFDKDFMRRFAEVVAMSPGYVRDHEVWVLEENGRVCGFYALVVEGAACLLDHLFLRPDSIGGGRGRLLFEDAAARARALGSARLEWEAEPFAVGFYERMGGRRVGETISGLGRPTPIMRLDL